MKEANQSVESVKITENNSFGTHEKGHITGVSGGYKKGTI